MRFGIAAGRSIAEISKIVRSSSGGRVGSVTLTDGIMTALVESMSSTMGETPTRQLGLGKDAVLTRDKAQAFAFGFSVLGVDSVQKTERHSRIIYQVFFPSRSQKKKT